MGGVILSVAVLQAERRISRGADTLRARSLRPPVKTRAFGMTPIWRRSFKLSHHPESASGFVIDKIRVGAQVGYAASFPYWNAGRLESDRNCHSLRPILPRMPVLGPWPNLGRVPSWVPLLKIKPFYSS